MARSANQGHKRLFALIALLPFWLSFASLAASPLATAHLVDATLPRPSDPSRKSLAWGPEHNHKVFADLESANNVAPFRRGLDSTRKNAYAAAIHYVNAEHGPKTPNSAATRLAKHLLGYNAQGLGPSGHDFYIRPDSYTDPSSGISHYFVRQLVNGLEVADGDLNINISPQGNILSFGSTLFVGQAPAPFTNQGVAVAHATSENHISQRCDTLRSELELALFPHSSSAQYADIAGVALSNTNEAFARGGVHQFVFESNDAAPERPTHRAEIDAKNLLPLQEELHELCGVPSDDPLLQGADLSSRLAGSLSHLRAKRDLHGPESIIDPRLALVYFLRQATPDEGLAARLSDSRAAESEAAQIVTTFEHKLQPHAGKTDSGAQASHTQIEYLHNVPTAKGPVPAQLAYVQTEAEGLNLVWKFQIPLEDNAYEAYADAHRPGSISTVVDWVHSMPRPRSKAAARANIPSLGRPDFGNRKIPELGRPDFSTHPFFSKPKKSDPSPAPLSHEPIYRVFKWGLNDPTEGRRSDEKGERYEEASPVGWHTVPGKHSPFSLLGEDDARSLVANNTVYYDTRGNNVFAQADPSGNGEWKSTSIKRPKGRMSQDGSTDMMFNYPYKWRKSEKKQTELPPADYVAAATVQLFVTINEYHDLLYAYGFDEASGNFQEHNFGRGGEANDGVIAFAQDGAGTDNADFMTPPDGQRGRMRMYVWDQSTPFRDGDFEAGIVIHEYSHGLSTRLTGGPANSGCLGWGESGGMVAYGLVGLKSRQGHPKLPLLDQQDNQPRDLLLPGPRRLLGVHAIGEVWATMLNEVEEALVLEHGFTSKLFPPATNATADEHAAFFLTDDELASLGEHRVSKRRVPRHGNSLLVQIILDGMKLQPCRPSFFDARDAIVQADKHLTGGQNKCILWKAFAKRGLGTDASVIGRTPWGGGKRSDGYAVPNECKSSQ
ncbi:related to extracellular elastinolytic metalloproteinase precursor [Melanopsichium pennsylvanicum]|uniref:Extracellular metalloproteinase n=1 Tax=Melanopsichium pennsylvanicum TaxID=63383 RepID=A0AAJ4XSS8_9BASI|nr:related to extracellular elastinolytic metalloproteinase precursor [Melanopsichium pennsylvanicum]